MRDEPEERPEGLRVWTGLCEVVDRVRVLVNRDLQAAVGLSLAENLALCQVAMAPGHRLRMVEIAGRLGVAKSAVTKTIDRLEERGLLVRERDPGDRRTVYATLSPAGHQLFAAAQPAFLDAVERHFTSHIDYDTLAHLAELPARITAAAVGAERKTR